MERSIPNRNGAIVEVHKLTDYLLSPHHPVGKHKARVFALCGYERNDADMLISGLKRILAEGQQIELVESDFGSKYIVEGTLTCSHGGTLRLRTVWIVEKNNDAPRFVTAYPA